MPDAIPDRPERAFAGSRARGVRRGGQWAIEGPAGAEEVTAEELATFIADEYKDLEYELDKRGAPVELAARADADRPELVRLRDQLERDRLSVMLDTTTASAALAAVAGLSVPTPIVILDLSVLTTALVCFDMVVLQPHAAQRLQPPPEFAAWLTTLSYDQPFIAGPLSWLYFDVHRTLTRGGDRVRYARRWAEFLAVDPDTLELDVESVELDQDSPNYWDGVPASTYFEEIHDEIRPKESGWRESLNKFLAVQTARTLFNDALAGSLQIPYLASSIRVPVHSFLVSRKMRLLQLLDRLLAEVSPIAPKRAEERFLFSPPVSAPFLLALVLERMNEPQDYWTAIAELRETFEPLRNRLRKDREQAPWEERPRLYVERFTKHLHRTLNSYGVKEDAGLAGVNAGLTVATALDPSLISLGIKLLKVTTPGRLVHKAYLRMFRPDIYLLFDLAKEAKRLASLDHRIEHIWGLSWEPKQQDQLERLSVCQSARFLQPGALM